MALNEASARNLIALSDTRGGTFKTSRELAIQQTKQKPNFGNLFDSLNEGTRKQALELAEDNKLLSDIRSGMDFTRSTLASKVVLGLAQELYKQSDDKSMLGAAYIHSKDNATPIKTNFIGETNKYGDEIKTPYGVVYIELSEFTRTINGGLSQKYGGNKSSEIESTINKLCEQRFHYKSDNVEVWMPVVSFEGKVKTKDGKVIIALRLCPVFTKSISNNFITLRKDTLQILKGRQKSLTMSLFWILAEIQSYLPLPTGNIWKVEKNKLLSEIATLPSYKNQSKRVDKDMKEAISKMEELQLIEVGGYSETKGKAGVLCVFRLNVEYKKGSEK